jgi:sugar lactone lactonase YvrE
MLSNDPMAPRIAREGLSFGECPRWHEGRLWYSDFYDHAVHALAPDGSDERVFEVANQPSGLGWLADGRLLVVSMRDRRVLRREHDGTLVTHGDLSGLATLHCNDMVVDAVGRAYVGNFGFDYEAIRSDRDAEAPFGGRTPATLARIDPDGTVTAAAGDLHFPNGTVLTPDGATLIIAESMAARLTAFDVAVDGTLSGRRVWADLRERAIVPDGICLDAEGAVWVANAVAPVVVRVGEGGEIRDEVTFSQLCFACMLGGPDGRDLYVMTAPSSLTHDVGPVRRGRIEVATVAVPHAGRP